MVDTNDRAEEVARRAAPSARLGARRIYIYHFSRRRDPLYSMAMYPYNIPYNGKFWQWF